MVQGPLVVPETSSKGFFKTIFIMTLGHDLPFPLSCSHMVQFSRGSVRSDNHKRTTVEGDENPAVLYQALKRLVKMWSNAILVNTFVCFGNYSS